MSEGEVADAVPDNDQTDARFSAFAGPMAGGEPMEVEKPVMPGFAYKMDHTHRGYAVIINQKTFQPHTRMSERNGTDLDAANLYERFKALGFSVNLKKNLTAMDMRKLVENAAKEDHSQCDCFVMVVLSHGDDGVIYGTDGVVQIDSLVDPFKGNNCKSLIGKPKLFFFQACRGDRLDDGVEVEEADADPGGSQKIPTEADILLAYSVVPGYFSWRNSSRGSWFVQALCEVLKEYGTEKDLLWMMTRVNHKVAYEFQSNASRAYMNKKKQIPCITSMLTKEVYFKPKQ